MNLAKTKLWHQKNYIFFILIIVLFFIYNYNEIISLGPRSIHQWRQADGLSIARNYYAEGMHFFEPSIHWIGAKGNGKVVSEFPLIYYFVAFLWKVFGKHEFIFRIVNLLIVFFGLFYLFKLSKNIFKNTFWAMVVLLILFSSPIFVYYANNFLVNVPAFSLVLPGWFFFYKFYKAGKNKYLYFSTFFFLIAGLLKISTTISLVTLFGLFFLELFKITKFSKEKNIFHKPFLQIVPFLLTIFILFAWYSFANHYSNKNNPGVFLQGILPLWKAESSTIKPIFVSLYNELLPQFLNKFTFHLILLLFITILASYKKVNKLLLLITISSFVATLLYIILFFQVFDVHDYYLTDLLIFPLAVTVTFLTFLKDNYLQILNSKTFKIIISFFLVSNIYYCAVNTRIKYNPTDTLVKKSFIIDQKHLDLWNWIHWNYSNTFEACETVTPYLRSLGIQRSDKVISIPDQSTNITLYLMDQKGFTDFGYGGLDGEDRIKKFISLGAKYLIINDRSLLDKDYLKPYLEKKIGEYKNILIYNLSGQIKQ
ncbi:MAG: glycosyltransferase family 39 protein [Bacteroidota bacterium]